MNNEIIEAYKAKMIVGKLYKNMEVTKIKVNDNGILFKVILNEPIKEKNYIGLFKYENSKYCFLLPLNKTELIVNIPSKYIKTNLTLY